MSLETGGLLELGVRSAAAQDFTEALAYFKKAILLSPNSADLYYHTANTLVALGKTKQAVYHLQKSLQLNENHAQAHNNLGRLFHKQKDFKRAHQHYQMAIAKQPDYIEPAVNNGLLWFLEGEYYLAKQQFLALLKEHANLPIVYEQLAQIALKEKDIQQAKYYYLQRMHFPIESSDTWNNVGAVFSQVAEYAQSIEAFKKALAINGQHRHARSNLAAVYLQERAFKEAIWEYSLYLRIVPTDATAYYNIGVAFMLSGRLPEAVGAFEEAVKLCPDYVEAWCNSAVVYVQQANYLLAYRAYQHALAIEKDHETALFMSTALLQSSELHQLHKLKAITIPAAAPLSYVKALFNNYASHFDSHLTGTLQYQVPQKLYEFAQPYLQAKRFNTLDLGCGTGLSGQAFCAVTSQLTGVDIARDMLREAASKSIYQALLEKDIVSFLKESRQSYELVLCVDTLVYFGDLEVVMIEVARITTKGGYFLFSVELYAGSREHVDLQSRYYYLQPTGRYQHKIDGVQRLAERLGWSWVCSQFVEGRMHQGQAVICALCLLKMTS